MATSKTKTTQELSKKDREVLEQVSELLRDARFGLSHFEPDSLANAGFIVGKAYVSLNQAEDMLDELLDFGTDGGYND